MRLFRRRKDAIAWANTTDALALLVTVPGPNALARRLAKPPFRAAKLWGFVYGQDADRLLQLAADLQMPARVFDRGQAEQRITLCLKPLELAIAQCDRHCRVCCCTDYAACHDEQLGSCWWTQPDLCSHCDPRIRKANA